MIIQAPHCFYRGIGLAPFVVVMLGKSLVVRLPHRVRDVPLLIAARRRSVTEFSVLRDLSLPIACPMSSVSSYK